MLVPTRTSNTPAIGVARISSILPICDARTLRLLRMVASCTGVCAAPGPAAARAASRRARRTIFMLRRDTSEARCCIGIARAVVLRVLRKLAKRPLLRGLASQWIALGRDDPRARRLHTFLDPLEHRADQVDGVGALSVAGQVNAMADAWGGKVLHKLVRARLAT